MAIPKSEKLLSEETIGYNLDGPTAYMEATSPVIHSDTARQIKIVTPLNDYVAVWQEPNDSTIVLAEKDRYKEEGVVIGVGPKVKDVKIGDVITFLNRPLSTIEPSSGFYEGERILLLGEHACLMVLKTIEVEIVN